MKLVISIIKTVVAKGFPFSRHRFLVLYVICSFYLFIVQWYYVKITGFWPRTFVFLLFREICYDISAFCFEAGHFIEDCWYF